MASLKKILIQYYFAVETIVPFYQSLGSTERLNVAESNYS